MATKKKATHSYIINEVKQCISSNAGVTSNQELDFIDHNMSVLLFNFNI